MRKAGRIFLLIVFITAIAFSAESSPTKHQSPEDSLKHIVAGSSVDSVKVHNLNLLVEEYMKQNNADSGLKYADFAISLAKSSNNQQELALALTSKGEIVTSQGLYQEGLKFFEAALQLFQVLKDKKNVANVYNVIANSYHNQGDFPKALKNQYDALKIREEIGDESGIAWSYNNIGTIYRIHGDLEASLKNYFSAMELLKKAGDTKNVAVVYNNIGNVYSMQSKYSEALSSYYTSLRLRLELGAKGEIAQAYLNIGDSYCDLFDKDSLNDKVRVEVDDKIFKTAVRSDWLDSAMMMHGRAQALAKELGISYYFIFSYSGMGRIYFLKKDYPQSIKLYKKAYAIAEELSAVELQKEIAKYLSDNYNGMQDYRNGMLWYQQYEAHKDTLFNQIKSEDLTRTRMRYEFEKKENEAKAVQDKKDALAKAELERQKRMRNIFQGAFAVILVFAGVFFYQRNNIRKEKGRSDNLLLNILPSEIATELKQTGASQTKSFSDVTVMFADFVDFTKISEKMSPEQLVREIHACFSAFDAILQKYNVEKIKTIGDAYLCASGLPVVNPNHAKEMIKVAIEIKEFIRQRKALKEANNEIPFEIRIGIHSGPVVAGIVGVKKYAYDIWGDTVNIAARMEQNSEPGKINISSRTHELVKDVYSCTYRGKIGAKNKGEIDMYFLES